MIIAISMRVVENDTYVERRDAISHDWVNFLGNFPITPVFVPNTLRDPREYLEAVGARGLLLTGGEDLDQKSTSYAGRDWTERTMLDTAVDKKLPVLGICRGLQMINLYFGGNVEQPLAEASNHINREHRVELVGDRDWAANWGSRIMTNSYHGNGVKLDSLASTLEPFALAVDGVVEGLYHPRLPIIAIQWHPERPNPCHEQDKALIEWWINTCG